MLRSLVNFWRNEDGMGTVEVVLIIVVLVGLVIVFKEQIAGLVEGIIGQITKDANGVAGIKTTP